MSGQPRGPIREARSGFKVCSLSPEGLLSSDRNVSGGSKTDPLVSADSSACRTVSGAPPRPPRRPSSRTASIASAVRAPRAPRDPRERLRLDVPPCSAWASDAHEEVAEAVIEPLDVGQHAHGAHGADGGRRRPCSTCGRSRLDSVRTTCASSIVTPSTGRATRCKQQSAT
jgi:hypothetical protein